MKCKNCSVDITNLLYFTKKPFCSKECEDKYMGMWDVDWLAKIIGIK